MGHEMKDYWLTCDSTINYVFTCFHLLFHFLLGFGTVGLLTDIFIFVQFCSSMQDIPIEIWTLWATIFDNHICSILLIHAKDLFRLGHFELQSSISIFYSILLIEQDISVQFLTFCTKIFYFFHNWYWFFRLVGFDPFTHSYTDSFAPEKCPSFTDFPWSFPF
jgi:hypothetical protein